MLLPFCFNPALVASLLLILLKEVSLREESLYYRYYTALGDSIAYGLGAPNRYGYVFQFGDFLKSRYPNVKLRNVSSPGMTSSGLLFRLRLNERTRFAVKNAGLITISIGGNNLLKSSGQNYTQINTSIAQAGVKRFAADWPRILSCIRNSIGSKAPILAMTLYNPYRYDDPGYPSANYFINQINTIIKNTSLQNAYGYLAVDVYEYFESNSTKDWTYFNQLKRNPHPNEEGHRQIFSLHKSIIET
jgi:lysophospholipase L1-like esterase